MEIDLKDTTAVLNTSRTTVLSYVDEKYPIMEIILTEK